MINEMNRPPMNLKQPMSQKESRLIVLLLAIILGCALALSVGCHTIHGIGCDLKSATDHYVQNPQ